MEFHLFRALEQCTGSVENTDMYKMSDYANSADWFTLRKEHCIS